MALALVTRLRPPREAALGTRLAAGAGVLIVLLAAIMLVALSTGPLDIPVTHVVAIIVEPTGIHLADYDRTEELVVKQIRLPRIVVGALVGMALGVAGAAMQALFRNPLADPGTIGVASGGAAAAVVAIATGASTLFFLALPLFALAGAIGTAFLVYAIAIASGRFSIATLILAGVAVSAFMGALISLVIIAVPEQGTLRGILFWLAGGLDSRSWDHVWLSGPLILIGGGVIIAFARDLNLLMMGDDDAGSMGVHVRVMRPVLLTAAALVTGVAVAVSGMIAFVGLIVPHMLRLIFGPDNRVLVPLSALGGAVFVVLADEIARTVISPAELRVGIITSFIGAPFFLFLLLRHNRRVTSL
ncbi:MAG: iron chelate uptake ABC transporter family permease subunit [Chloroflexi bacterium]|nr:iron chelate uptake ABC transporter family permease subunit [Chloroflexota bacterium]